MENQAIILSRQAYLNAAKFMIPTDKSIRGMTLFTSCGQGIPSVYLYEPNGKYHQEYVKLTEVDNFSFWLVENIAVGQWSVEVKCAVGPITLEAKSESSINFEIDSNTGDSENLVIKSLSLPQLKLSKATVYSRDVKQAEYEPEIVKIGSVKMKKSNFASSSNTIDYDWMPSTDAEISASILEKKSLDFGQLGLTMTPTKITGPKNIAKITAEDGAGNSVQREVPIFDSFLQVKDDVAGIDFQPGATVFVTVKINNNNEVMHLTATDFEGWVDSVTPASTSAMDKVSLVKVKIIAPADVKIGQETTVTITARDNSLNRIESAQFILSIGQTENPEVKKMLVESNIENRFGRTIVQSKVVNQHRFPRDAVFSVFLPDSAFITSYQLYIRNHTFKGEIIEPKHLEHPTDWVTPSTVTMENEHEWRVKVIFSYNDVPSILIFNGAFTCPMKSAKISELEILIDRT